MTPEERAVELDAADPLAHFRDRFTLPEGVIYLDGNSLGALPKATPQVMQQVIAQEWGEGLIRSWNSAGWFDAASRIGAKISPLIGAAPDEVIACWLDQRKAAGCDDFIVKIKADFLMIHSPPKEGSEDLLVSIHKKVETWLLYYAQNNILMVPGNLRAALQTFEGSEVNEVNQKTTYTMQHDPGSLVPELKKLF